jgi:hypothetical protein
MAGRFFLKFPRPPTPGKPDANTDHLGPLKTHCPEYFTLVSTSKIFFGCDHVLGIFPASSNETLKLSLFLYPHSTDFHHFHLANEAHDKQLNNGGNGSVSQEPLPQEYQEQSNAKLRETKDLIGNHQRTNHLCLQLQPRRTVVHKASCRVFGGQIPPVQ